LSPLDYLLAFFWIFSWTLIAIIYAHSVALSVFGVRPWRRKNEHAPRKRFAVLVPAHNEASVIRPLLEDLQGQSYPRDLFDVYVIADNCTDDTAHVAASVRGVRVILRNGGGEGKGQALRAALETVLGPLEGTSTPAYDAIVFFDADNRVSRDFLRKVNSELCDGHRFIQGYLGTKNAHDNWVTRAIYQSYCMTNRLWQLGKRRAGLPSQCGGTGFCVDADILRDLGWPMTSTTEDLEMVCLLALKGIYPVWCHDARVYDEKPTSVRVALNQRIRWMRGHFTNLFRYIGPLFISGVRDRDAKKLDCALYLLYPIAVLCIGIQGILWFLGHFLIPGLLVVHPGFPLILLVVAIMTYYPILGIYLETKSWREVLHLPILLAFNWIWVMACFVALFTFRDRRWYHTPHKAALDHGIRL